MRVELDGQGFELLDLSPDLDAAFADLYRALFRDERPDLALFEDVALAFFDRFSGDSSKHDEFFNNFSALWRWFLREKRFDDAEGLWRIALQPAHEWEQLHAGQAIHKGTPFYFWAVSALQRKDLAKAHVLMHQALQEDARTHQREFPETPAFWFATLGYENKNQFFRAWVLEQAEAMRKHLAEYRRTRPGRLDLDVFRQRFLARVPSSQDLDVVSLFTYTLARLVALDTVPDYALSNSFAGQLELNILFDLCLVIENAIAKKNPSGGLFVCQAAFLSRSAGQSLNQQTLGNDINGDGFAQDFDRTLTSLLDGTFKLSSGRLLSPLERDLAIAYGIRNRGAHETSSVPTLWQGFSEIKQRLFNVLFLCIEKLY